MQANPTPTTGQSAVRHRHVFFLAGFDRKRPRYYHALYRSQGRRQAAVSGIALEVSRECSRPSPISTAWTTTAGPAGARVNATCELLEWHDIVDAHWTRQAWKVALEGASTVLSGWRDGAVQRMFQLFRPPVYATLLPLLMLTLCTVAAIASGIALAWAIRVTAGASTLVSGAIGVLVAVLLGMLSVAAVHRMRITWLLRLVRFTQLQAGDRVAGLDQRLSAFAQRIAAVAAVEGDDAPDEILIVGHSVGANLAVSVLARVLELQDRPISPPPPVIRLLSLGQCMPLLSSLSQAERFRRDLQRVATSSIDWLDITAPIDWAAFPQVDPVAAAGLPPAPPGWHPRLVSPRFHRLFSDAAYARLKRKRFQVHMQYLKASEYPGRYDYFAITAGPSTLRERFEQADADETLPTAVEATHQPPFEPRE